ncbi:hypothetical protein ACLBR5_18260 [Escherichia coli]
MALAIGSHVQPSTVYIPQLLRCYIALTGGSRFSVFPVPTAAFVVILYPVSQQFTDWQDCWLRPCCGIFLILMGLARFGRLIEYIPVCRRLRFHLGYRDHHRYHAS